MYAPAYSLGLGQAPSTIVGESGGLLSSGIAVGVSTGLLEAGGTLAAFGAIAGPIGAIAGVLTGIFMQVFSGCGQTCTLTSDAANKVAAALQQNLNAWNASQKTQSEQAAALANFDYAWSQLQQVCGSPSMGNAGVRCLSERQRGGVSHWCCKASNAVHSDQPCNGGPPCCTGCDYFVTLRDPIANDPNVVPDEHAVLPIGSSTGAGSLTSGSVSVGSIQIPTSVLLLAGVGLLAVVVFS